MFENKPAVANFKCSDQELCVEQVGKDEGCNVQQGYMYTFDHEDSSLGNLQLHLSIYYSIKFLFAIFNLC